ncbi:MAG: deoxynucleoside kinase [Caldilineales bacterium]|nr:deoxynucleoside kinase [Caldilineales bacterium]MDW8318922.1 deoxynucleoside kinase [Anaerolineae bacterium]
MSSDLYIAVEGPIGVGKTTLARILSQELGGQLMLEVFEENPFLSDFYADRARYAFQTQIFFLLSRYRQQQELANRLLSDGLVVSDYLFDKDRLFAHLNLSGDELAVYERVHAALGEKTPVPTLVVYLRASTDVLMSRIAFRDRSYERAMSRQYIDDLRRAYERFFADYTAAPVLSVDTNELNVVANEEDRRRVVSQVRVALEQRAVQQPLPELAAALGEAAVPVARGQQRLGDLQRWQRLRDQALGLLPGLYLDYLGLAAELGALGQELRSLWLAEAPWPSEAAALRDLSSQRLQEARDRLRSRLAEALTYLLKIANDTGIDLEAAYLAQAGSRPPREQAQEKPVL